MRMFFGGMVVAASALAGCSKGSEPGGSAGDETFRFVIPTAVTDVRQGEVQTVRVQVERGGGFKHRIKLETKAPAGLTIHVNPEVGPEDKGDVQITITAANDAPLGEHVVQLKGIPDKGSQTTTDFRISVKAK